MKKLTVVFILTICFLLNYAQTAEKQMLADFLKNFAVININGQIIYEPLSAIDLKANQSRLSASVSDNGIINLMSVYFGKEWILHNSMRIKIGEDIYSTEQNDSIHKMTLSGGLLNEKVSYTGSNTYLSKMISMNRDKEIRISFIGQKTYDYILSEVEKKAISETYELAQLLRKLKVKE